MFGGLTCVADDREEAAADGPNDRDRARVGCEMKIAAGSDHAGYDLKMAMLEHLAELGIEAEDLGTYERISCDYPDYAEKVARAVVAGTHDLGLLICGTGIGMCMTANKVEGIRAAMCTLEYHARMARAHNGANILCMGGRVTGVDVAKGILSSFIHTPVSDDERHLRRRAKIMQLQGT